MRSFATGKYEGAGTAWFLRFLEIFRKRTEPHTEKKLLQIKADESRNLRVKRRKDTDTCGRGHCKADRYHYKCTISSSKWASTRSAVILHFTGKCNPVCTHVDKPSVCVCIPTLTFSPVRNKMSLLLFKVTNLSIYALDQSILLSQNTSQIPSLVYLIARLIELFFHITNVLKPFPFT